MQIPFYLVDVFAVRPLTGNPLAVVPQAEALDEFTMQQIAREFNQAETTFLVRATKASADWRLRSFTAAGVEVFGAGHNSLGAWWWLAESGVLKLTDGQNRFTQEIGDRLLPVDIYYEGQRMAAVVLTQTPPLYGSICEDIPALARSLGLTVDDLMPRLPAQVVSTGAAHLLVPVRAREAVGRARPDTAQLARILDAVGGQGCYLFSLDPASPSSTAHARFFNPTAGIVEDAATGSAAGPLACQLIKHAVAKDDSTVTIEQGHEMQRPSLLRVHVSGDLVRLAGRCVTVANGTLRVG
jgi:trans-2,3-dihydro-3-hydroxyanthranilate isomerase